MLGPPPIHNRIAALFRFLSWLAFANRLLVKAIAGPAMAAAPAKCCMKCRRVIPSGIGLVMGRLAGVGKLYSGVYSGNCGFVIHQKGELMVENELVAVEQHPEYVLQSLELIAFLCGK